MLISFFFKSSSKNVLGAYEHQVLKNETFSLWSLYLTAYNMSIDTLLSYISLNFTKRFFFFNVAFSVMIFTIWIIEWSFLKWCPSSLLSEILEHLISSENILLIQNISPYLHFAFSKTFLANNFDPQSFRCKPFWCLFFMLLLLIASTLKFNEWFANCYTVKDAFPLSVLSVGADSHNLHWDNF